MTEIQQLGFSILVGRYRIDLLHRRIRNRDDQEVILTPGEFSLLMGLLEHRGQIVDRTTLHGLLQPSQSGGRSDQRTVDTLMVRLRRKLECDPSRPRLIQTVYGKGYRLANEDELSVCAERPSLVG